jgi:hypothetical protein
MAWDEIKDKMNTAASILRWELANMWGHVSVRKPDGGGFILMHLRPPNDPHLEADEVLEYDIQSEKRCRRRHPLSPVVSDHGDRNGKENRGDPSKLDQIRQRGPRRALVVWFLA